MNPKKIIDISVPFKKGMPVWPKSVGIHLTNALSLSKGDSANVTRLDMDLHTGTHIESPLHFIPNGFSIDKIPLGDLIGPVVVVYSPKIKTITAANLEKLILPKKTTRLLFRTFNSNFWQKQGKKFQKDFVGLSADAAFWIVKRGIQLVGIDYLSIARYDETVKVHQILLKNKVIILEGLNLSKVKPGKYQLICLPIKLINTEAASARAILLPL
jgi:arylformamidase